MMRSVLSSVLSAVAPMQPNAIRQTSTNAMNRVKCFIVLSSCYSVL